MYLDPEKHVWKEKRKGGGGEQSRIMCYVCWMWGSGCMYVI